MRILASDGMDKSAVASLKVKGHEVVEQFYEPNELGEQLIFVLLHFLLMELAADLHHALNVRFI